MKLQIKKIILDQFKGVSHAEYDITNRTEITGRNASGKTTIADAYYWLFTDKDSSLKSNPEVHPDYMEASQPSVTIVCDIDGKEVTLRKLQKDSRNEKQIAEGAPIRISNQYEVNAVPKSQKDFIAYLEEGGVAVENFLLLSHPEIFTGQKSADCRKILFGMVSDTTDAEIAKSISGCEDVGELLESYTVEEIQAMKKREKKEADENIDAIPNQIIGLEKAKVETPSDEFMAQKETLESEVASLESDLANSEILSDGELNQKLVMLEKEQKQLTVEANADRVQKLTELDREIGGMKTALTERQSVMRIAKDNIANAMTQKTKHEKTFEELKDRFAKIKAQQYEAGSTKCPYCKQELPIHMLAEAEKHFESDKQKQLDEINLAAKDARNRINSREEEIKARNEEIRTLDAEIIELEKRIADKVSVREPLERVIDMSGTEENERILKEILSVKHQMEQRDSLVAEENEKRRAIKEKQQAIREIDDVLAQWRHNDTINQQILDLRGKQKEYAQAKADAEKILYQLQKISMAKNNMLEEQVNGHFTRVKFRLFVTQKNGEVKDDCTPMVLTDDGEYRDMTYSANTAAIKLAQLDIIDGLQKFYNQHFPVFLDGAECLDENHRNIKMDTQLIMACVSDGDLKVEV